ncbi:MAG: HU family DNA-binding protein [Flavobacteriaceae bacterium]|nr:HU family DNA-binding protein [Flavobacteriaceae bacterium]
MNKNELITAIAEDAGMSKTDVQKVMESYNNTVTKALQSGDKVTLVGWGTWEVSSRAARKGRNPQTGAEISIAASKGPKFKAGKAFKDAINK